MILQALYDYYQRKAADSESKIAPFGLEWKEIPFLIVIDKDGNFINLADTREGGGKIKQVKRYCVAKSKGRSGKNSWQTSNILWDHLGYVLGHPKDDQKKTPEQNLQDAEKQHSTFIKQLDQFIGRFPENNELAAVSSFYKNPSNLHLLKDHPNWEECIKIPGCNMSFQVTGELGIVAEHADLTTDIQTGDEEQCDIGRCLITGNKAVIATLHSGSTIPGGKAGAKIVGFQKGSGYDSYNKIQGLNAPVSVEAESAYTTALNTLLSKESRNKFKLCDTTYLFWAEKDDTALEKGISFFMSTPSKDDPDRNIQEVRSLLQSVDTGILNNDEDTGFYILGLAPNAARIAVRLWLAGTVKDISENMAQHFKDLEMIRGKKDSDYFSLFNLLSHTALEFKMDNVQPIWPVLF